MLISTNFNLFLVAFTLLLKSKLAADWVGNVIQNHYKYAFGDYWSTDKSTCIIADATLPGTNSSFVGVPSIEYCDRNYVINNKTLILPRNTIPNCGYVPSWYDLTAEWYMKYMSDGFRNGNTTFDNYKNECLDELKVSSKSKVEKIYNGNVHEMACLRYGELMTIAYGTDNEIKEIVDEIESKISQGSKWKNSKLQAHLFVSTMCVATNKGSCISLLRHVLDENDNSVLNLFGANIQKTPSTWIYADGIDIKLLHYFVEIMGMSIETKVVSNIHYHTVSAQPCLGAPVELFPGLVGGSPIFNSY